MQRTFFALALALAAACGSNDAAPQAPVANTAPAGSAAGSGSAGADILGLCAQLHDERTDPSARGRIAQEIAAKHGTLSIGGTEQHMETAAKICADQR